MEDTLHNPGIPEYDDSARGHAIGAAREPWYALQVRTTIELRTKALLEHKGYTVFVPVFLEWRRYSDRIKKVEAPLFPGYAFCRFNVLARVPVLRTPGVVSIAGIAGVPCAVEEREIDAIRTAIGAGARLQPWPYLRTGDRVRVEFGPMAGVEGILARARGGDRLVLSVNLLNRSVAAEVDRMHVRPLTPDGRPDGARAALFAAEC